MRNASCKVPRQFEIASCLFPQALEQLSKCVVSGGIQSEGRCSCLSAMESTRSYSVGCPEMWLSTEIQALDVCPNRLPESHPCCPNLDTQYLSYIMRKLQSLLHTLWKIVPSEGLESFYIRSSPYISQGSSCERCLIILNLWRGFISVMLIITDLRTTVCFRQ